MNETQLAERPTKAPVLSGERGLRFSDMESMWRFCTAVVNSKQFGREIDTPEVALIRLQAGLELGLTPIWSLTNIFVVNGKPTVYGDALLGIVRANPQFADIRERIDGEGDEMVATCEVERKGQTVTKKTFSVRDAKRAGLWGKSGPWTNYPQRMLAMRARSWACRDAFADALRGLGVVEEYRDIEPKPVQAREVERPKLILPDEEAGREVAKPTVEESVVVDGAEKPAALDEKSSDCAGSNPALPTGEIRNEKGEFVF